MVAEEVVTGVMVVCLGAVVCCVIPLVVVVVVVLSRNLGAFGGGIGAESPSFLPF